MLNLSKTRKYLREVDAFAREIRKIPTQRLTNYFVVTKLNRFFQINDNSITGDKIVGAIVVQIIVDEKLRGKYGATFSRRRLNFREKYLR